MKKAVRALIETPVELTPAEFEHQVEQLLQLAGIGLPEFQTQRLELLPGADGTYEIDITARFKALGASFLVLIECKHHKKPIKRDIVQVLYDRLRATGGHKGMIFATTTFQKGAVAYAQKHGIALVQIADGKTSYCVKGQEGIVNYPPWVSAYVGWIRTLTNEGNEAYRLVTANEPNQILERFTPAIDIEIAD